MRRATAAAVIALLVATAGLYGTRLSHSPVQLMHDEVNFALQAKSLADTGRDTNGRLLPVYFSEQGFEAGRDPVVIYLTALMLKATAMSETTVRLPTALAGVLSVGLMFLVARRLFASDPLGLVAAALLALTPAHFINSRLVLSIAYPIPFILAWLWCLSKATATDDRRYLLGAGLALGAGLYSYVGSLIMMPVYLAVTLAVVRHQRGTWAWPAMAGFATALIPLLAWQVAHPDRYTNLLAVYRFQDAVSPITLQQRLTAFWMFFNPDYLFVSGDSRLTNSTRMAGLLPLACAVLIPVGVVRLARGQGGSLGRCVLAGLLSAPLATAISGRLEINRALHVLPFAVLAAVYGVSAMLEGRRVMARVAAVALVAGVAVQFAWLYSFYMTDYRQTSEPWFGGDSRGAVNAALRRAETGAPVYLDGRTPIERYWRFYALAHNARGLLEWPVYFDAGQFDPQSVPAGGVLVCSKGDAVCAALATSADWRREPASLEWGSTSLFEVFEKLQPGVMNR